MSSENVSRPGTRTASGVIGPSSSSTSWSWAPAASASSRKSRFTRIRSPPFAGTVAGTVARLGTVAHLGTVARLGTVAHLGTVARASASVGVGASTETGARTSTGTGAVVLAGDRDRPVRGQSEHYRPVRHPVLLADLSGAGTGGDRRAEGRHVEVDPMRRAAPVERAPVREVLLRPPAGHRPASHGELDPVAVDGEHRLAAAVEQRPDLVEQADRDGHPYRVAGRHRHVRDRQPVAVGGDEPERAAVPLEQHAAEHGSLRVVADREAHGVEGGAEPGGGHGQPNGAGLGQADGHRILRTVEGGADRGELPAGVGETAFQPAQVRVDQPAGVRRRRGRVDQPADLGQRHADPTQPGDQPSGPDLVAPVAAVAGPRVDRGGPEHTGAVVEPQRADRQPARAGQLADAEQVVLHPGDSGASTCSTVNLSRIDHLCSVGRPGGPLCRRVETRTRANMIAAGVAVSAAWRRRRAAWTGSSRSRGPAATPR